MADEHTARWAWMRERTLVTKEYAYLNTGFCGARTFEVSDAMKRRIDLEMF